LPTQCLGGKMKYSKSLKNDKGQGLIEYLILVALIAVVSIGVVKIVGNNISTQYENVNRAMGAGPSQALKLRSAGNAVNQKDLSSFIENARSN
jgi:pilus assembly protein Flp/PilA